MGGVIHFKCIIAFQLNKILYILLDIFIKSAYTMINPLLIVWDL